MQWIVLAVILSPWLALLWRARQHAGLILLLLVWVFLLLSTFFSPNEVWMVLIVGGWVVFGGAYVALHRGRVTLAHVLVAALDVIGLAGALLTLRR
jgi:hypothetical protein